MVGRRSLAGLAVLGLDEIGVCCVDRCRVAWHVDFEVDLDAAVRAELLHFMQICGGPDLVWTIGTLGSEIGEDRHFQGPGLSI